MVNIMSHFITISFSLFVIVSSLDTTLNVTIYPTNGNGFYQIFVNNELWLESGQIEAYFNNMWSTTNLTNAKNSGWNTINLISKSSKINEYDYFGGKYSSFIYSWQTTNNIKFDTIFKIYDDGQAISFVQSFPYQSISGTDYSDSLIPPSLNWMVYQKNPFLTFPSFNVINNNTKYASKHLGYLTWSDGFCESDYGIAPLSSMSLNGINGGPVVLYDNNHHAILVSTNDNFAVSTQTNIILNATATFMYNNQTQDSVLCLYVQCYVKCTTSNYIRISIEGVGLLKNYENLSEELIQLQLWYSSQYNDTYVATTSIPPDSTYTVDSGIRTLNNGYIYVNDGTNRLSLDLYYNQAKHDHATVASTKMKNKLLSEGYVFNGSQGYITMNKAFSNDSLYVSNDWRLGISSQVMEIPKGFQHETVLVVGDGINDVILNKWSKRIRSLYPTPKVEDDMDIITSYLSYWTDNGAYYCCKGNCSSLDVMKDVKNKLDEQNITVKYWQMDDWWYYGYKGSRYWSGEVGVRSISHWVPSS
eukprot:161629_1